MTEDEKEVGRGRRTVIRDILKDASPGMFVEEHGARLFCLMIEVSRARHTRAQRAGCTTVSRLKSGDDAW